MLVSVAGKEYNVKEAKTKEELLKGLKGVSNLPKGEGMLFFMPDQLSQTVFTMEDMLIPLDIVFINQDKEVVDVAANVQPGQPQVVSTTENLEDGDYIAYVLEVNPNSGIEVGDDVEFETDEEDNTPMLKILGPDGEVQGEVGMGARIFRRAFTKQLIRYVKKAVAYSNDEAKFISICKAIGRKMFKEIKAQDNRKPEYVQNK